MSFSLFLRKRRVLLVIFVCSLTYFIIATYKQLQNRLVEEEDLVVSQVRIEEILKTVKPFDEHDANAIDDFIAQSRSSVSKSFNKRPQESDKTKVAVGEPTSRSVNTSDSTAYRCRNSVQGRAYIADENGYICDRFDLQVNGCCKVDAPSTVRYKCDTCSPSGCCALYEQCVSCCLHPQKVYLLRKVLEKKANNINRVYSLITDHFDLCLTKCRTSSESVRHENSYIDSRMKYCYGSSDTKIDAFAVNKTKSVVAKHHL